MGINSIKALAERVDASEIIPFLEGCGKYTLVEGDLSLSSSLPGCHNAYGRTCNLLHHKW